MARCLHYKRKNHYPVFRKDFGYLVKSGGKGAWASLKTRQANSLIFLAPTAEVRLSGKLATDFWRSWTFNWAQLRQHNHVLRIATVGIRHTRFTEIAEDEEGPVMPSTERQQYETRRLAVSIGERKEIFGGFEWTWGQGSEEKSTK